MAWGRTRRSGTTTAMIAFRVFAICSAHRLPPCKDCGSRRPARAISQVIPSAPTLSTFRGRWSQSPGAGCVSLQTLPLVASWLTSCLNHAPKPGQWISSMEIPQWKKLLPFCLNGESEAESDDMDGHRVLSYVIVWEGQYVLLTQYSHWEGVTWLQSWKKFQIDPKWGMFS